MEIEVENPKSNNGDNSLAIEILPSQPPAVELSSIDRPPADALLKERIDIDQQENAVVREIRVLFRVMRKSAQANRIYLLFGCAFAVLILNMVGEVRMNKWQGAFFRAVEQRKLHDVGVESVYFVLIVAVLLTFVVTQNWLIERLKIRVRQWLTGHLLDHWMQPAHAYRLNMTSEETLNPDQRIQEDVKNFCEMSAELGLGALRSVLLLVSFVGVLWVLSRGISLRLMGHSMVIPGYMVWFAMLYAGIGSWLAGRVGRPLIKLNEQRYTREANFRYNLVRISDNAESIAFYSGEHDERKNVNLNLEGVLSTMRQLSFANARLTYAVVGHGWMVVILPVLVALPGYLQGKLDFGGLMMVVGAFNQVQQSLRWFVENYAKIADWRAILHRVVVFHEVVSMNETADPKSASAASLGGAKPNAAGSKMIELTRHEEGHLAFDATSVSLMDGEIVIADATATIRPGERVLLVGESGSGKSTLLRAVGGLWPWGSGQISLPPANESMFLPQKPYIPLGTLANALAYPKTSATWEQGAMEECLKRVNLESFIALLQTDARWDKMMSLGQQQRLAFARLLLHRPKWVFLDEATSALDDANQERMMSIFQNELAGTALLSVGHRTGLEVFHTRTLVLMQSSSGCVLMRKTETAAKPKLKNNSRREFFKHWKSSVPRPSFARGRNRRPFSDAIGDAVKDAVKDVSSPAASAASAAVGLLFQVALVVTCGLFAAKAQAAPSFGRDAGSCVKVLSKSARGSLATWTCEAPTDLDGSSLMMLVVPHLDKIQPDSIEQRKNNTQTLSLVSARLGLDHAENFVWGGVESANPLTRDGSYRWNSIREAGLYDPQKRAAFITMLQKNGITHLRIGLPNHEVTQLANGSWDELSWRNADDIINDLSSHGIEISLDLHHFGIEDRFAHLGTQGKVLANQSYYLDPAWPDYFAGFASEAYRRYYKKIRAVTIINEPETTVGFQGQMWNGAYPGWSSPINQGVYIERALQVGLAAVKARSLIEDFIAKSGDPLARLPFVHTEAVQRKTDDAEFNAHARFLVSDLILGQDWLVNADFETLKKTGVQKFLAQANSKPLESRSELEWLVARYLEATGASVQTAAGVNQAVTGGYFALTSVQSAAFNGLMDRLARVSGAHHALKQAYGTSMRANTVFGADYYAQNESYTNASCVGAPKNLDSDPRFYADQVVSGERRGFGASISDYYQRYRLPVMVSETGTVYNEYAAGWFRQLMIDRAVLKRIGIPILAITAYPVVDTYGWESALARPRSESVLNPAGIFDLDYHARPSVPAILRAMNRMW